MKNLRWYALLLLLMICALTACKSSVDSTPAATITVPGSTSPAINCEHVWNSSKGKCAKCDLLCEHTWDAEESKCTICRFVCSHENGYNEEYTCDQCGNRQLSIRHEFTYESAVDGRKIWGFVQLPTQYDGKLPAIIMSHGHNSTHTTVLDYAEYFAGQGYACIAFDYCGGAERNQSDGKFEDMTLDTEKQDLYEIIDYVKTLEYVDADKLILFGESQGGLMSLLVGSEREEEISGMILLYPAFSIPKESANALASGGTSLGGVNYTNVAASYYEKMDAMYAACTMPVLILHGDVDRVVDVSWSQNAVDLFPDAELIVIAGGPHGFHAAHKQIVFEKGIAFLEKLFS